MSDEVWGCARVVCLPVEVGGASFASPECRVVGLISGCPVSGPHSRQVGTVSLAEHKILQRRLRAELTRSNVAVLLELASACERAGLDEEARRAFARVLALAPANRRARQGRLLHFRRCYAECAAEGDSYGCVAIVRQIGEVRDRHAVPWLVSLLDAAEPVVCQTAAQALGKLGDRAAVPSLIGLLRNDAARAWWQASEAIAAIGDRAALPALLATLAGSPREAAAAAAHALGLLGDPAALEGLAAALAQGEVPLRRAAAAALGQLGRGAGGPTLAAALALPDPGTRRTAAESLGTLTGLRFRGSLFSTAERRARRWWKRRGQFRPWPPVLHAHAALDQDARQPPAADP